MKDLTKKRKISTTQQKQLEKDLPSHRYQILVHDEEIVSQLCLKEKGD
jgi:hypothetical protein